MRDYLFLSESLDDKLRSGQEGAARTVEGIDENRFLISTDDQLYLHVVNNFLVDPLVLYEDKAVFAKRESQVDVSGDSNRYFSRDRSGPFYIPGTAVTITIPFTGMPWIWEYRTNPFSHDLPVGRINLSARNAPGMLELNITLPHDAPPERFKQLYDANLVKIRECIKISSNQIAAYHGTLEKIIRDAILARRKRLEHHAGLAKLLNIPIQDKAGAPTIEPIRVVMRNPPPLPSVPKGGLHPEPGIDQQTYEHILNIIRHEGRTFETTPATFAKHDEEGLRNIILAHLNGHLKGGAAGEVFRRRGKTDIRIEDKDRSAFIGECKVWRGANEITKAAEQLLNYLTWRDSKAALIIFNKDVAAFSELLPKLRDTLVEHPLYISEMKSGEHGEFRMIMRSVENEGRRVTVHVFLFNLYH